MYLLLVNFKYHVYYISIDINNLIDLLIICGHSEIAAFTSDHF